MKYYHIKVLLALFLVSTQFVLAQKQIIINEISQGPLNDWEWIEYLVLENGTDIRGVYLDDDDTVHGTIGSAKLVQLKKDLPEFENVQKGSIIVLYKSPDSTWEHQQDPLLFEAGAPDTDFSDGVIIIPHTNTEFLEPGSWWPQFRSEGDNLGIFDSTGLGIHGVSYGDVLPKGDFSNGWGMTNLPDIPYTTVGFYTGTEAATVFDSTLWLIGVAAIGTPGTLNPGQSSVPVELVSFTAFYRDNNIVLNWRTATEKNNFGFEIERSVDQAHWNKIGFINGNGTTTEINNYEYVDKKTDQGSSYYYRLKQIDFNGAFTFSKVLEINSTIVSSFQLEQNYPNPFNPSTTINFSLPDPSNVSLKIFNTLGEEVKTLYDGFLEAGVHSFNFNATGLTSGVYVYVLRDNENRLMRKMMLLK